MINTSIIHRIHAALISVDSWNNLFTISNETLRLRHQSATRHVLACVIIVGQSVYVMASGDFRGRKLLFCCYYMAFAII